MRKRILDSRRASLAKALCAGLHASCLLAVASAQSQIQTVIPDMGWRPSAKAHQEISSPDGQIKADFAIMPADFMNHQEEELVYAVSYKGRPVIEPSPIRLQLEGQSPLGPDMNIDRASRRAGEDQYRLLHGKTSEVKDRYNALIIDLSDVKGSPANSSTEVWLARRRLRIEARVYDDAVAFRYIVPDQPAMREFRLVQDDTEFRIAKDATVYAQELPDFHSQYEEEYLKLHVTSFVQGDTSVAPRLIGLPLTMELPGVAWVSITEADMRGNAGMYLMNPLKYSVFAPWHGLISRISPSTKHPDAVIVGGLPHQSPWRVLLIGDRPGALVESNVITSLNPPPTADFSWVKPGKSAWEWWSGRLNARGKREFSTANMKYYVDFAAASGFPYMLVDSDWSAPDDLRKMNGSVDIPELVRYAATKNVKIWIWCHWALLDAQLEPAFTQFEKWGVAGVKTDFLSRDDQSMIEFYYRSAGAAARHHLMTDYHGASKPTGMERTWPNVMGYEGVLGMEQSHMDDRDDPEHHVMIPFTRMVAGPVDYTPGGFRNVTRDKFVPRGEKPEVMGTRAHHLAMYVVFEAAIQMVSDSPDAYAGQPSFRFIKEVPASWDETRVLAGSPGQDIVIARRAGKDWYLGAMTNWEPRDLEIPLSFLGSGSYRAEIYSDAADATAEPTHVDISNREVTGATTLREHLVTGGGVAIRFTQRNR